MSVDTYISVHGARDLLPVAALRTRNACPSVVANRFHSFVSVLDRASYRTGAVVCLGCGVVTIFDDDVAQFGWGHA